MKFQVTAKVEKELWSNGQSYMYKVIEQSGQYENKWTIFAKTQLLIGSNYIFDGTVSESKDKKRVTSDQKAIYNTNFNAEKITPDDSIPF